MAPTLTSSHAAEEFDPAAWGILKPFRVKNVTYSRCEPLPMMSMDEARRHEASGAIARRLPDGRLARKPDDLPRPDGARGYLLGTDLIVLKRIRQHRPRRQLLQQILAMAKSGQRSPVLIEALELIAGG